MVKTVNAVYDGKVFQPDDPLTLAPNTRVRITIEYAESTGARPESFLSTARSLDLHGPRDWAENLDAYLYGRDQNNDG